MTELTLDIPGQHYFIRSLDPEGIRVGDRHYSHSLIIGRYSLIDDWPPQEIAHLESSHFDAVLSLDPEVVLLGTGARQVFLPPAQLAGFYRRQIGLEVMTTEAACRTFNVLVSEGRNVVTALLPLTA